MLRLCVVLCLCLLGSGAYAVTCPDATSPVLGGDSVTFATIDETGHCPAGYAVYDSPSHLTAYFNGIILSTSVTLCGAGEYMNNGVCTAYTKGRCDNGYITVTTDESTVGAIDNTGHCAPGYAVSTTQSWMYVISTGAILNSTVPLCDTGEYMSNGTCTAYSTQSCPTNWFNYVTANSDTFVPTVNGACGTNYVSTSESIECGTETNESFCASFCASGESLTYGGQCVPICSSGATKFHVGNFVFPIYAQKTTTHAVHIGFGNGNICYVNLASGHGTGALHVQLGNETYHTTK